MAATGNWDTDEPSQEEGGGALINDSVERLYTAWRTEVNAPEILPFKEELVEEMQQVLKNQENFIEERMEAANENDYFTVTLYQMDIERVRYSLSRYLRTRLLKIENAVEFLEMSTEAHDRLSFHEKKYHAKLKELNDAHFDELAFGKLSERVKGTVLETDRDRLAHAHPNLQEFVFCKVTEDIRNVEVSPDLEPMNLDRGDVHVMQYAAVQQYVLDGSIQLL